MSDNARFTARSAVASLECAAARRDSKAPQPHRIQHQLDAQKQLCRALRQLKEEMRADL